MSIRSIIETYELKRARREEKLARHRELAQRQGRESRRLERHSASRRLAESEETRRKAAARAVEKALDAAERKKRKAIRSAQRAADAAVKPVSDLSWPIVCRPLLEALDARAMTMFELEAWGKLRYTEHDIQQMVAWLSFSKIVRCDGGFWRSAKSPPHDLPTWSTKRSDAGTGGDPEGDGSQ